MDHIYKTVGALIALSIVAGFTSEQSGGKDSGKQSMNLSGTLVTQIGHKEYKVENISIAGMIKDIRLFQIPDTAVGPLSYDPHGGIEFKVKLEKGVIIEVPSPKKTWTYQRNERASKVEYIAIAFTPCDQGERQEYIVETTRPILCQDISACDPIAMRIPLSQIERIVIEENKQWQEVRTCPIKTKKAKNTRRTTQKRVVVADEEDEESAPLRNTSVAYDDEFEEKITSASDIAQK